MKKFSITFLLLAPWFFLFAQEPTSGKKPYTKAEKRKERRQRVNELIKQAEEGVLVYSRQTVFGLQFRTNGYGAFLEFGQMKTNRITNIYRVDFIETKHLKEYKQSANGFLFSNTFIYAKQNYFYQLSLGIGQQYILGQKGNKNGIAVTAVYNGGLAIGLLRPYYIEVMETGGRTRIIKYSKADSAAFLGTQIVGNAGFSKGWNEIKIKPGLFGRAGLRFDYGRFNETVSALEVGVSTEFFSRKIPIMVAQKEKQFFFQGYISILFGRRR